MLVRRFATALTCSVLVLLGTAPIAAADPAKPTDYRSRILAITPATRAISVKVVGGDGFLDLHVRHGHDVVVAGYEGEPWLRISRDGRVQQNLHSTATYLNASRYAKNPPPPGVNRAAAVDDPRWSTVATGGVYVWHDHRIHYMNPQIAPTLVPGTNRVALGARPDGKWEVPLTVDGRAVTIVGELLLYRAPNAAASWAIAAALVAVVTAAVIVRRELALPLAVASLSVAAVAGTVAGWRELLVVPSQAGGNPVAVGLPFAALVAAVLAVVLRNAATRAIAVLAGAAAVLAWAMLRVDAFGKAVPLSDLSPTLARSLIAVALGGAVAAVIASVRTGALALAAPLDPEDEADEGDAADAPAAGT